VARDSVMDGGEAVADCCFAGVAAELLSSTQKKRCNKVQRNYFSYSEEIKITQYSSLHLC
jgi:hypothetical protein